VFDWPDSHVFVRKLQHPVAQLPLLQLPPSIDASTEVLTPPLSPPSSLVPPLLLLAAGGLELPPGEGAPAPVVSMGG
jgi:hypothetical protein